MFPSPETQSREESPAAFTEKELGEQNIQILPHPGAGEPGFGAPPTVLISLATVFWPGVPLFLRYPSNLQARLLQGPDWFIENVGRDLREALRFAECELPGRSRRVSVGGNELSGAAEGKRGLRSPGRGPITSPGRGTAGPGRWSPGFRPETPGPLSELTPERGPP